MSHERAAYLIKKLISNSLSTKELDELLVSVGSREMCPSYSALLEEYFQRLLHERNE